LIKDILEGTQDFSCAGCFSNGTDALAGLSRLCPDLVLMDIRLPDVNGIECTKRLKHAMPGLKIIMMSGLHDLDSIAESIHAGAVGYLGKPITTDYCLLNLRVGVCVATEFKERLPGSEPGSFAARAPEIGARLTKREIEVLDCLAEGLPYKGIADELQISFSTVHKHAHSAFRKLHVTNRTEAVRERRARN
jgi:DNA-binding NarL/FixJ family response regulator